MKKAIFFSMLLSVLLIGCDPGGAKDSAQLDAILATGRVDTVVIFTRTPDGATSFYQTNYLRGAGAIEFVAAFNGKNRNAVWNSRMVHTGRIEFMNGSNEVVFFNVCDSQVVSYEDYTFTLKHPVALP